MVVAATEKRSKAVRFCKNLWISLHSAHWWNYSFFWTNNLIKMHSENTKWKDLNKSLWHLTLFAHLRHIWSLYLTSDKCHQDNGHQEIQTLACKIYFYWGGVWLVGWLVVKKNMLSNIISDGDYDWSPRNGSDADRNSAYGNVTPTYTLLSVYFQTICHVGNMTVTICNTLLHGSCLETQHT